jgi:hypothetical protein
VLLPPQGVIFPNKEQWADVLIVWPEITVSLAVGTQLDAGNAKLLGTSLQVAETSHHSTLASHQLSTTTLPPIVSSLKGSPVRAPLDPWPACVSALERRLSLGSASAGAQRRGGRPPREIGKEVEFRGGSAINFPGNPRFRPRVAFKMASSTEEMDDRRYLLTNYALIVKEEGSLGLRSSEELKDLILHHFGIRKHEIYAYRSSPDPFIAIFSERRGRDLVFAAGRIIDGPVELRFRVWDLDEFGDRAIVPYHVKLSIEGIPQHAWSQHIADKVIGDAAIIHHVDECTRKKIDQRSYQCWAFSKEPSNIPQIVFLTMTDYEVDPYSDAQVHFVRLCSCLQGSDPHRCSGGPHVLSLSEGGVNS